MAQVKILTDPVREGSPCEVQVTGVSEVTVVITVGGAPLAQVVVNPPFTLKFNVPKDGAGKTLRVAVPGDFDSAYVLVSPSS